jgi:hypothetical protein
MNKLEQGDAKIIATALNTTPGYVSQVLNGHRNNQTIKIAHKRLRKLKISYRKQLIKDLKEAIQ